MGMISLTIGYFLIAFLVAFGFYYKDFREVSANTWISDPIKFTNELIGFHVLFGIIWPLLLIMLILTLPFYIAITLVGKSFGYLAKSILVKEKHGYK